MFRYDKLAAVAVQHLGILVCFHEGPRAFPGIFELPSSFQISGCGGKENA